MNLKNAIVHRIKTMKDGSLEVVLHTRELSPQQMAELFFSLNKEVLSVDIPEGIEETKSKAQRLRDVLWHVWENNFKDKFQTFPLYYDHVMSQLIDRYKEKIDL